MKKLPIYTTFIIILFIIPTSAYSQVTGKIIYKSILESEKFKELESVLIFSGLESYFFVNMLQEESPKKNEELKFINENEVQFEFDFTPKRPTRYEVYINRNTNSISSQSSIFKDGTSVPCVVIEDTGLIEWEIVGETRMIGSFIVKKATAKFRGRNYIAWFSPEIPLSIGPWKFNGLPGLILEIKDEESGVQFLFSSIEIPYQLNNRIEEPSNGIRIPIDEYMEHNRRFGEEFLKLVKAKLPRDVSITEISMNKVNRSIEREYN